MRGKEKLQSGCLKHWISTLYNKFCGLPQGIQVQLKITYQVKQAYDSSWPQQLKTKVEQQKYSYILMKSFFLD